MASGTSSGQPSSSKTSAPETDTAAFAAAELAKWPKQGQSSRVELSDLTLISSCIQWTRMNGEYLKLKRPGRESGDISKIRTRLSELSPRPAKDIKERREGISRPWVVFGSERVPIHTPAWINPDNTAQSEPEYVFDTDQAAWLSRKDLGDGDSRAADKWPFKLSSAKASVAIMWRSWHYSESKGEWVRVYRIMKPGQQPVPLQPPARIQTKVRRGFFACRPNKWGMQP